MSIISSPVSLTYTGDNLPVTAANPLQVRDTKLTDGTQTTQISGTVPLPTGAATAAKQPALGTSGTASTDVITVQGIAGAVAVPISALALPLPAGAAADATLTGGTQRSKITDGTNNASVKAASTAAIATDVALVVAISPNNTVPVSAASLPLPAGASTETTLASRLADATFTTRINTLGQKASSASTPVVLASDQPAIPVTSGTATAGTASRLTGSLTAASAFASNAAAKKRFIFNEGPSSAYVLLAAGTASATNYTFQLLPLSGWSDDSPIYTGAVSIVFSAATGAAQVTENT